MTIDIPAFLNSQRTVKELAYALAVSTRYVYEMRNQGFRMHGKSKHFQTASVRQARAWLRKTEFRMVDGKGECKKVQTPLVASKPKRRAKSST